MNRRQFLALSSMSGAMLLSRCATRSVSVETPPQVVRSQNGLLQVELTAAVERLPLADRTATLMAYNRQVPGPRLEATPGDRVQIRFTNRLAESTNLHFHGLHIPPTGEADNPFRDVKPGETATYDFEIPTSHPGGLFWYHPHYHGLVAQQVVGGLAGALVIRGTSVDTLPALQAAEEAILVLQDFDLDRRGQLRQPAPMFRMWGREGNLITVNGQPSSDLLLPQHGLLRLRILNSSPSRIYQLRLPDHPWFLIATDGMALANPVERGDVIVAPGERVELLVPGNQTAGSYPLISLPYDRGIMGMMQAMGGGMGHGGRHSVPPATAPVVLGQVVYQSPQTAVALPTTLATVEPLPEPVTVREFVLDHGIDPQTGDPFLINGRAFDHHRIDVRVKLGTVEDWVLINNAGMDHPFHLHTNPFQVISRNGEPELQPLWKDVINVRAYETVRIRIPFRDFAGKTVYHCHILDHEDQGMMGIVEMA
jgi:FtsP/CotA-like multicopper oxidase with cupredoxin domain